MTIETEPVVQQNRTPSGTIVSFTLGDVVCPELTLLFDHVGPELVVCGQVVFMSDSGEERDHFAIVDVEGVYSPLIVPVRRLRPPPQPADQQRQGRREYEQEGSRHISPAS